MADARISSSPYLVEHLERAERVRDFTRRDAGGQREDVCGLVVALGARADQRVHRPGAEGGLDRAIVEVDEAHRRVEHRRALAHHVLRVGKVLPVGEQAESELEHQHNRVDVRVAPAVRVGGVHLTHGALLQQAVGPEQRLGARIAVDPVRSAIVEVGLDVLNRQR